MENSDRTSNDWKTVELGSFVTLQRGHDLPIQNRREGKIPILGSFGVTGWHDESKVLGPGVTVGRSGASFGVVTFSKIDYWPLNTALFVKDFHGNDPLFAYYLLKSMDFTSYNAGSAVQSLNRNHIHPIPVLVPPLGQQRAIAQILGTLDDKIELNRRMNATLESMARAMFQSWFVDFDPVRAKMDGRQPAGMDAETAALFPESFEESELGLIPKGWRVAVLDELTNFVIGGDWGKETPQEDCTESVFCIRGADIPSLQAGGTGKMPVRFISKSSLAKRRLNVGDIAFEISGGSPTQSTGRPVLANEILLKRLRHPLTLSNFCRLIRPASDTSPMYLFTLLRYLYQADEFLQYENGSTGIKNFAFTVFSSIHRLLKPNPSVMRAYENVASRMFDRIYQNGHESDALATLRDTLLPKLISGELSVKHAEKLVGEAT